MLWRPETHVLSHIGKLMSREWKLVYYFVCVVNWLAMLSLWQKDTDGKILAMLKSLGKLPRTRSSGSSSPTLDPLPQSLLSLAAGLEKSRHDLPWSTLQEPLACDGRRGALEWWVSLIYPTAQHRLSAYWCLGEIPHHLFSSCTQGCLICKLEKGVKWAFKP